MRWLTPEQEVRLVQRVKACATQRDGVASLRGRQLQWIPDHEFGKVVSLTGTYKLLKRHGLMCLALGRGNRGLAAILQADTAAQLCAAFVRPAGPPRPAVHFSTGVHNRPFPCWRRCRRLRNPPSAGTGP
jgi:hypothetical protein